MSYDEYLADKFEEWEAAAEEWLAAAIENGEVCSRCHSDLVEDEDGKLTCDCERREVK